MEVFTNRGFLDLENYGSPDAVDAIAEKLKGDPSFIKREIGRAHV